ncbi:MAG: hypothetical protein ISQ14_13755, partial [Verrucomicrobiae bacterium]|nr:hypothetical protein [Verrucomicrobiae bacterium]
MRTLHTITFLTLTALHLVAATPDLESLFRSARFKARFTASYGFNSEIEPTITAEEKKL